MPQFRFKACVKCGGDQVMDYGDWICLQCGTYYYVGLYQGPVVQHDVTDEDQPGPERPERDTSILANRPVATMNFLLASVLTDRGPVFN